MSLKVSFSYVFSIFLFFLPFTQALTVNIGFALKISEILILFLIVFYTFRNRISLFVLKIIFRNKILLLFLILVLLSFLVNLFWQYSYPLKKIPSRITPIVDSFLRLVYIFICVGAYFVSIKVLSKNLNVLSFWVKGGIVAASYSWYLFISSAFGLPYLKLPGMLENPQALYGVIRSGTFLEGNFFGLFLILSAAIAFYLKKEKSGWYLLLSVLTSLSSISIISSIVFVIIYYKSKIFQKKYLNYLLIFLPALILGIFLLMQSTFYQNYIYKKIATPSNILTTYNFSKVDRLLTSRIAYNIGVNNPILGVGPYNYSLHYDQYNDINQKVDNLHKSEFATNYFNRINVRAIPNNVYLEIWSEYGILSFLIYLMFLINLLYTSFKLKEPAILGGFVALLLSFNAFPSFIMLFLWVYLAIPYALIYNKKLQEANLTIVDEK